jgi:multiple sugar transport system ATP-binding protein
MARLVIEGLTKRFGRITAVSGLSLEAESGTITVLLGPTGAGKTTTLRCVAGLERPDGGVIRIGEQVVNDLPPKDRDVAFVFQNFSLYPRYTVFENIASPLRIRNISKEEIERRVKEVACFLHIDHLLSRRPIHISGGEMQRVAIARALVRNPRVFLLDEPLTNLDAKIREEMRTELKRLQSETGATFLYATPDQAEALSMGDRIVVIRQGHVVQVGTPQEIYHYPRNVFVADFVGSPGMNFVPAIFEGENRLNVGPGYFTFTLPEDAALICRKNLKNPEVILAFALKTSRSLRKRKKAFTPRRLKWWSLLGLSRLCVCALMGMFSGYGAKRERSLRLVSGSFSGLRRRKFAFSTA